MSEIEHLHEPFMRWLRQEGIPFIRARSDRRSTLESGVHDVTVLLPNHRFVAIEFKDKSQDLSKDQRIWRERCEKAGVTVYVIRKLEDAVALVQEWRANLTPLSAPAEPDKMAAGPVSESPLRVLKWCGQMWTVSLMKDPTGSTPSRWSLLHKSTPEELATLKPV